MKDFIKARIADKYTAVDDRICVEDLSQIMDEMGYRFIDAVKYLLKIKRTYHELKIGQVEITQQEVENLPREDLPVLSHGGC